MAEVLKQRYANASVKYNQDVRKSSNISCKAFDFSLS